MINFGNVNSSFYITDHRVYIYIYRREADDNISGLVDLIDPNTQNDESLNEPG